MFVGSPRLAGAFLLGAAVLAVVGARAASPRFVFPGAYVRPANPTTDAVARTHEGATLLHATARDGTPVRALSLEGPRGAPVVVHFHNNRDAAEDVMPLAVALRARGVGVVVAEYRGYGAQATVGAPSEAGLFEDAEALLDAVARAYGAGPDRVVLWGTSLGTGVAAEMARRGRGGALVLVTPYTSIPGVVSAHAPWAPASLIVGDRFDTAAGARSVRAPVVVVHGDADEVVPYAMGVELARTYPDARLITVHGGRHGDLFGREGDYLLDVIARLARELARVGQSAVAR